MPWEFDGDVPAGCDKNKAKRSKWITNPETRHHVYSGIEGLNPNQRVRKRKADDEGNAPFSISHFIADFDIALTEEEIETGLTRAPHAPHYLEQTISGNLRAIWSLPKSIRVPNYAVCVQFLEMLTEKLQIQSLWGGLDKSATINPTRRWTNSGRWAQLDSKPLSEELVDGWVVGVLSRVDWASREFGPELPMEKVAEELRIRYPGFADWPGDFVDNSQGPTFWIEESKSPKSAIAHPTGMYTFSAHAGKTFYSWRDLLGKDFVEDSQDVSIGGAVKDIFHDGRSYWWRANIGNNVWKTAGSEDVKRDLKAKGLTAKAEEDGPSMIDRALLYIQKSQHIDGVAAFIHTSDSVVEYGHNRYLNTYRSQPLSPAPGPVSKEDFPFVWDLMSNLFASPKEFRAFMLWLRHTLVGVHNKVMNQGQVMIIVGPANVGKTFMSRYIVGALLGGFADASRHITSGNQFDEDLFESPLWCIDDTYMSTDSKAHRQASEQLKSLAANNEFRSEGKFKKAVTIRWHGRVIMTMNCDALSIQALPNLDISILEKLMILKTSDEPNPRFLGTKDKLKTLAQELPYFARYILDMPGPTAEERDERFGVEAVHTREIVGVANQASRFSTFADILKVWRRYFFEGREDTLWTGSTYDLYRSIQTLVSAGDREISLSYVRTSLNWLESQGRVKQFEDAEGSIVWTIQKD